MTSMNQTFQHLNILDLSSVLAGPSVGTFFAELGADVTKIEHPDHPDATRSWKQSIEDENSNVSAYFSSINYKKKYMQLNLKEESHHAELMTMVEKADIVLMNFKKGAQKKLNIADEQLYAVNSRLIIGKISGFGDESDRVAYDLVLQAETGFMSMNGTPESGPVKMPLAFIDILAAHQLKEGLLIELLRKEQLKTEYKGTTISVSLYDAAVASLANQASNYLMTGKIPQRIGSLHPNIAPYGELFTTKDDKTITFAIGSDAHFKKLCTYFGVAELADDNRFNSTQHRVKNRTELEQLLAERVNKRNATEILKELNDQFVPCGEIKDLKAVFNEKEAQALIRQENIEGLSTKRVSSIAFKRST
jgi:crotonobetainyl-CoA:carnitine CoA-transferase CaiB-like acyl-CoA transferase